jgi:hypothetical protein
MEPIEKICRQIIYIYIYSKLLIYFIQTDVPVVFSLIDQSFDVFETH